MVKALFGGIVVGFVLILTALGRSKSGKQKIPNVSSLRKGGPFMLQVPEAYRKNLSKLLSDKDIDRLQKKWHTEIFDGWDAEGNPDGSPRAFMQDIVRAEDPEQLRDWCYSKKEYDLTEDYIGFETILLLREEVIEAMGFVLCLPGKA
jgi:hypothetical protein